MHFKYHYSVPNVGPHATPGVTQTFTIPLDVKIPTRTITRTVTNTVVAKKVIETVAYRVIKTVTETVAPTSTAIPPFNATINNPPAVGTINWLVASSCSALSICLLVMTMTVFYCSVLAGVKSHRGARQGLKRANKTYEKMERLGKAANDQVKTVNGEITDANKAVGKHKSLVREALEVVEQRLTARDAAEKVVQPPGDVIDMEQDSGSDSFDLVDYEE
ncbi:hypothetical protein PGQ11_015638 [Apiospora arundinis]|uniref:Uncharacterized protein n=1 Tax=Apiospora arundinis TaxID=335852 RepID=A0ABR2HLY3_9PEZI